MNKYKCILATSMFIGLTANAWSQVDCNKAAFKTGTVAAVRIGDHDNPNTYFKLSDGSGNKTDWIETADGPADPYPNTVTSPTITYTGNAQFNLLMTAYASMAKVTVECTSRWATSFTIGE
jgi:hypothetical protein